MTDLIFVDVSTTGTEHWARVWEIAALTLDGDSWHAAWQPSLNGADLEQLRATRLVERYAAGEVHNRGPSEAIANFAGWVRGRGDDDGPPVFAGDAVHATLAHLQRFAGKASSGIDGGCHLRVDRMVLDVGVYAAGALGHPLTEITLPALADACDVTCNPGRLHLPMYRAWLARELYGEAHAWQLGGWPNGWVDVALDGVLRPAA